MNRDPGSTRPWSVVLADDHPVVRLGVRALLAAAPDFVVAGEAGDGEDAVALVRKRAPDVLLLDLSMPKLPGIDALRELADEATTLRTVILTGAITRRQIVEALQLGARGIVLKDAVGDHLVAALRAVVTGRYWVGGRAVASLVEAVRSVADDDTAPRRTFSLTPRELDVVGAIVEGRTNRDIAQKFSISEDTVKRHLTNIFDKTGVSTRLELAMFALHHGVLPPS